MKQLFILISILATFLITSCASTSELTLAGDPPLQLKLDRPYSIIAPQGGPRAYMLTPTDGDSSAVILVGEGGFRKTRSEITKEYGKVKTSVGQVNGNQFRWLDYSDTKHLYSTGESFVTSASGKKIRVYMDLVANSAQRMQALKDALKTIQVK